MCACVCVCVCVCARARAEEQTFLHRFESRAGHRLPYDLSWFSAFSPPKYQETTSNRPRPHHSESFPKPKAATTLEPETTQHNKSGQTPDKELETQHITVYVSGYNETDPTGMLSPQTVWRQHSEFDSSRQSGQIPAATCIGFECCCNGRNICATRC